MTTNSLVNLAVCCMSCSLIRKVLRGAVSAFPNIAAGSGDEVTPCDKLGEPRIGGGGRRGISAGTGTGVGAGLGRLSRRR